MERNALIEVYEQNRPNFNTFLSNKISENKNKPEEMLLIMDALETFIESYKEYEGTYKNFIASMREKYQREVRKEEAKRPDVFEQTFDKQDEIKSEEISLAPEKEQNTEVVETTSDDAIETLEATDNSTIEYETVEKELESQVEEVIDDSEYDISENMKELKVLRPKDYRVTTIISSQMNKMAEAPKMLFNKVVLSVQKILAVKSYKDSAENAPIYSDNDNFAKVNNSQISI